MTPRETAIKSTFALGVVLLYVSAFGAGLFGGLGLLGASLMIVAGCAALADMALDGAR